VQGREIGFNAGMRRSSIRASGWIAAMMLAARLNPSMFHPR